MKFLKLMYVAFVAILTTSCGGGNSLEPTSTKINGPLGQFFEVVEKPYKLNNRELSVEYKRIALGGPTDASWSSEPTFTVELLDEDGNVISSESTSVVYNEEQLESVFGLNVDETSSITLKFTAVKGAKKFKVSSKWKDSSTQSTEKAEVSYYTSYPNSEMESEPDSEDDYSADNTASSSNSSSSSETSGSSSKSSKNWDATLDSYEKYVDKYISYMKKAANGDMNALSEYPSLMKKAEEFNDQMKDAQGDMTAAQWSRYTKITQKLMNAAQDL